MFYDRELTFLQKTLSKLRLQSLIFHPDETMDNLMDGELMELLLNEHPQTFYDLFPDIRPRTVYRVTDIFACRYLFLLLPYCERTTVFLIGPYLYDDLSAQQLMETCEQMGLPPARLKNIEYYCASIPVIKDENYILTSLTTFAEFIWDGVDCFTFADVSRTYTSALESPRTAEELLSPDTYSADALEMRYRFENELIDAVQHGNIRKAEQMMSNIPTLAFEMRIPDQLRSIKNYCIIMNTLFRKAVEYGGVHPVYINALSSEFAKRIESLHAVPMAQKLMQEILRAYCNLVKERTTQNYSPMIKKAVLKIESDLLGDLSLRAFAESSKVSPEYFSAIFKKETGQTLTAFVTSKRVENAKYLLRSTNLQIQTVAQHCGILDFHYFCRVFKKVTGTTPSAYRSSLDFR